MLWGLYVFGNHSNMLLKKHFFLLLSYMFKTVVLLNIFCGNHDFFRILRHIKLKRKAFIWNRNLIKVFSHLTQNVTVIYIFKADLIFTDNWENVIIVDTVNEIITIFISCFIHNLFKKQNTTEYLSGWRHSKTKTSPCCNGGVIAVFYKH